jgi:hypothetical protein
LALSGVFGNVIVLDTQPSSPAASAPAKVQGTNSSLGLPKEEVCTGWGWNRPHELRIKNENGALDVLVIIYRDPKILDRGHDEQYQWKGRINANGTYLIGESQRFPGKYNYALRRSGQILSGTFYSGAVEAGTNMTLTCR